MYIRKMQLGSRWHELFVKVEQPFLIGLTKKINRIYALYIIVHRLPSNQKFITKRSFLLVSFTGIFRARDRF